MGETEGHDPDLGARVADLERREAEVMLRENALTERTSAAQGILAAADDRDAKADLRDAAADKREADLDLARFLSTSGTDGYLQDWPERRWAVLDRQHSKGDRTASRDDRVRLSADASEDAPDLT